MAISDKLTTLNGIKSDIKAAIIAKGGTATDDFTTYATAISNLPSGGGGDEALRSLIDRSITSVDIPDGTTSIGDYAFFRCVRLTSIEIPNSVTLIRGYAFYSCTSLTSITIPDSVTSIGDGAFYGCNDLTSATIGNSVTSIGTSVFYNCTSLASITCTATTPPTIANANAFNSVPATCAIYVPAASVDTYKAANIWSTRADYIQAIQ